MAVAGAQGGDGSTGIPAPGRKKKRVFVGDCVEYSCDIAVEAVKSEDLDCADDVEGDKSFRRSARLSVLGVTGQSDGVQALETEDYPSDTDDSTGTTDEDSVADSARTPQHQICQRSMRASETNISNILAGSSPEHDSPLSLTCSYSLDKAAPDDALQSMQKHYDHYESAATFKRGLSDVEATAEKSRNDIEALKEDSTQLHEQFQGLATHATHCRGEAGRQREKLQQRPSELLALKQQVSKQERKAQDLETQHALLSQSQDTAAAQNDALQQRCQDTEERFDALQQRMTRYVFFFGLVLVLGGLCVLAATDMLPTRDLIVGALQLVATLAHMLSETPLVFLETIASWAQKAWLQLPLSFGALIPEVSNWESTIAIWAQASPPLITLLDPILTKLSLPQLLAVAVSLLMIALGTLRAMLSVLRLMRMCTKAACWVLLACYIGSQVHRWAVEDAE